MAQNSGKMKVFETTSSGGEIIRLKKDDAYAILRYQNNAEERREFYYGSGYLSNSSRVLKVPDNVNSIRIASYSGEIRTITFEDRK